eukprot:8021399-Ditylum_brightwellii.AAC.1
MTWVQLASTAVLLAFSPQRHVRTSTMLKISDTATTTPTVHSPSSSPEKKYASLLSWFNEVPDSCKNLKFTIRIAKGRFWCLRGGRRI